MRHQEGGSRSVLLLWASQIASHRPRPRSVVAWSSASRCSDQPHGPTTPVHSTRSSADAPGNGRFPQEASNWTDGAPAGPRLLLPSPSRPSSPPPGPAWLLPSWCPAALSRPQPPGLRPADRLIDAHHRAAHGRSHRQDRLAVPWPPCPGLAFPTGLTPQPPGAVGSPSPTSLAAGASYCTSPAVPSLLSASLPRPPIQPNHLSPGRSSNLPHSAGRRALLYISRRALYHVCT